MTTKKKTPKKTQPPKASADTIRLSWPTYARMIRSLDFTTSETLRSEIAEPDNDDERVKFVDVPYSMIPILGVQNLLRSRNLKITDEERQKLKALIPLVDVKKLAETIITGPFDLGATLMSAQESLPQERRSEFMERKIANEWVAIQVSRIAPERDNWGERTSFTYSVRVGHHADTKYTSFWTEDFRDETGNSKTFTVGEVLAEKKLRIATEESAAIHREQLMQARKLANQPGTYVTIEPSTVVAMIESTWSGHYYTEEQQLLQHARGVIEPFLELETKNIDTSDPSMFYMNGTPFVRVFCLDQKRYFYVHVSKLKPYKFDEGALDKLILPASQLTVLTKIFETDTRTMFADTVAGKHGGMVVLANGGPGRGKTLTAEIFAEHTKRPLYSLEIGELGTDLETVEERIRQVFTRASRWNAVLLFDEADIFLMKRGMDLERSAIVGVFLRLLDYYPGMLFLTTNRADVIDEAFQSRITVKLDYPELTSATRSKIWGLMLEAAGFKDVTGDLLTVADLPLNGRQIRNAARLLRIMVSGDTCSTDEIETVIKFSCSDQPAVEAETVN